MFRKIFGGYQPTKAIATQPPNKGTNVQPVFQFSERPRPIIAQESEYRPCYVRGRKALFHRWVNTARPVLPRDADPDDKTRFFQYRITQALVEYEDGTVDRVWPQDIRFADRNRFKDYAWDDDPAYTQQRGDYDNN